MEEYDLTGIDDYNTIGSTILPSLSDFIVKYKNLRNNVNANINCILENKSLQYKLNEIRKTISVDNNGILRFSGDKYIKDLSFQQFERFLLDEINSYKNISGINIKKIDISNFNNENHMVLKEKIFNITGNNFPFIEISRLKEGDKVVNILFLGIKNLNDNISKEFVDLFSWKLKEFFHNNFLLKSKLYGENGRVIRNNYKNMTFSLGINCDIGEFIFGGNLDKGKLILDILNSIDKDLLIQSLEKSKIKDIEIVKDMLLSSFNFGVGVADIERDLDGEINQNNKLIALYNAEISSKNDNETLSLGERKAFDFTKIKSLSEKIVVLEEEIITLFDGKTFYYNNVEFDIIIDGKINNILLRHIRKNEDIGDVYLEYKIKEYLLLLNNGFDFIAPFISKDQLNETTYIEKQIRDGIIDVGLIDKTYKNTYSLSALKSYSRGEKGLRVFIDIVDMGIMNLKDFRLLSIDVASGKIDKSNVDELLSAGKTATIKFQRLVSALKEQYNDAKIALGGDEVFIFIPGRTEKDTNEIILEITEKLKHENLVGRIASSVDTNNSNIFDYLDNFTSINKIFEKVVDNIINNKNDNKSSIIRGDGNIKILSDLILTSINIDINSKKQKFISENLGFCIYDIKRSIDITKIKDILTGKQDGYLLKVNVYRRDKKGNILGLLKTINLVIEKGKNIYGLIGNNQLNIVIK